VPDGTGSLMRTFSARMTRGLRGSLVNTSMLLCNTPLLYAVATFATILPCSPGLRWLELAIAAVHPQEVDTFEISRSSVPELLNSKVCSSSAPWSTSPKS